MNSASEYCLQNCSIYMYILSFGFLNKRLSRKSHDKQVHIDRFSGLCYVSYIDNII